MPMRGSPSGPSVTVTRLTFISSAATSSGSPASPATAARASRLQPPVNTPSRPQDGRGGGGQQVVAPADGGAKGLLPGGAPGVGGRQRQAGPEPGQQRLRRAAAGRGRRPARWPAAGLPAACRSRRCRRRCSSVTVEAGPDHGRVLGEQAHCRGRGDVLGAGHRSRDRQRRRRHFVLAGQVQRPARGGQHHQAGGGGQELGDDPGRAG